MHLHQENIISAKVGVAHDKQTLQWHPSLCFHVVLFSISCLTLSNLGQTRIISKLGLTWMTRIRRDPDNWVTRPGFNAAALTLALN